MSDLRVFASYVAVVEEGSVSGGARRVGITQPAMSRQIAGLERELGVRLLVRGEGPQRMTPAGARFYDRVTDLLAQAENVIGRTKQEIGQRRHTLHVIAPSATIQSTVVPFLTEYGDRVPVLDCEVADPFQVFDLAAVRAADLGISTRFPRPGWRRFPLGPALLRAQASRDHPLLAGRASVTIDELVEHPLVLLTPNNAARRALDEEVLARDLAYREHLVVRHPSIAQALAASGRGIAVLTDTPLRGSAGIPILGADGPLTVPIIAGWDPHNPESETIESTMELFRDYVGAYQRRVLRSGRMRDGATTAPDPATTAPDAAAT